MFRVSSKNGDDIRACHSFCSDPKYSKRKPSKALTQVLAALEVLGQVRQNKELRQAI